MGFLATVFAKRHPGLDKARKTVSRYPPPPRGIAGPGTVVRVADKDAGGMTTYVATGATCRYRLMMRGRAGLD